MQVVCVIIQKTSWVISVIFWYWARLFSWLLCIIQIKCLVFFGLD